MNRTVGLRFPECAVRCLDHVKVDVFLVTIVLPVCHIDIGSRQASTDMTRLFENALWKSIKVAISQGSDSGFLFHDC